MREKTVKRYWCDHCNKAGLSRFHMARHEGRCTKNPQRTCAMHHIIAEGETVPTMPELLSALEQGGFDALRDTAHQCPACTLAAIVQFPWPPYPNLELDQWGCPTGPTPERHPHWQKCAEYDYKKDRDAMWAAIEAERQERYYAYHYY